jgi:hypothetical protein
MFNSKVKYTNNYVYSMNSFIPGNHWLFCPFLFVNTCRSMNSINTWIDVLYVFVYYMNSFVFLSNINDNIWYENSYITIIHLFYCPFICLYWNMYINSMNSLNAWIKLMHEFICLCELIHEYELYEFVEYMNWSNGFGYMAWKWICISLESWMVSWYKNKIVRASVSNCMHQCLNCLVLNIHIPMYLGSRGKPFFWNLEVFFGVSADPRLVWICVY